MQEPDFSPVPGPEISAVEATISASDVLLEILSRSISDVLLVVSFPQYRLMAALLVRRRTFSELAAMPEFDRPTLSDDVRILSDAGWIRPAGDDPGGDPLLELSEHGTQVLRSADTRRENELERIFESLLRRDRRALVHAFDVFARAAAEASARP